MNLINKIIPKIIPFSLFNKNKERLFIRTIILKSSKLSDINKDKYNKLNNIEFKKYKLNDKRFNNKNEPLENTNKLNCNIRLAKKIAMSGISSRREAEKLILDGKVMVNNKIIKDVATNINKEKDIITVNGKNINIMYTTKLFLAHKLKGELVTSSDPKGRPTIINRLRKMGLPYHLMPVGRLDYNSEGLLLLTNNGDYAQYLEHPKNYIPRKYNVLVKGNVTSGKISSLQKGILIDKTKYRPIMIKTLSQGTKDTWLELLLREGKNREIRKAMEYLNLTVIRLIRTQYGPFQLKKLRKGDVLEVPEHKIKLK